MNRFIITLLFLLPVPALTQSVQYEQTFQNRIVELPLNITYSEFCQLQRDLNWKRIFAASFIPGYIHFYSRHTTYGWSIAGARAAGFALIGYAFVDELNHTDHFSLSFSGSSDSVSALKDRSIRNMYLFIAGVAINMIGYAFDWAHGDFIIEQERNAVLYKYGLQKSRQTQIGCRYDTNRRVFSAVLQLHL